MLQKEDYKMFVANNLSKDLTICIYYIFLKKEGLAYSLHQKVVIRLDF